ncbi:MAG: putative DNA binding domain-containing protein [Candidatus Dependentiae bacterium]|nr:putative DNA binding domain-containing protein [Candidatus Dependentiae bacterium]
MKIAQLKALVKRGESETLEFKSSIAGIKEGMKTVCAFLNSDKGGTVLIGVKDDGKIIGQDVADSTRKTVATEINKIEPHAKIDVKYVCVVDDRHVIVLLVNPDDRAPYTYDGRPYMRNQSTTMYMPRDEQNYLYNRNNPGLWERLAHNTCTIKDLDHGRIKEVVRMAVFEQRLPEAALSATTPNILKKLNLMVGDKLTNAAVILFCKDEDKQFMQSSIQLARFKGTTKSEFLNNKKYRANIFDLYDKAMDFLVFCLPVAARIEPGKSSRVETPAIPYSVLREALINALAHRDNSNAGGNISVAVYDDRVNITNVGALPRGVELSKLSKEHPSIQRNPLISSVLFACGKIERWGRGTLDMIEDSKNAGNPLPIYEEIGGSFSVTLPLKEPMPTIIYKQSTDLDKLTDRQKEIIEALQQGPLKMPQIMKRMSIALTDRTTQLELAKLKKMGLIKSIGKTKSTIWALSDSD